MTLLELRDFLNSCPQEELEKRAVVMSDVDSGREGGEIEAYLSDEDYYYSEDGCFPKSCLGDEDFDQYMMEGGRIQWPKGSIFIDFKEI